MHKITMRNYLLFIKLFIVNTHSKHIFIYTLKTNSKVTESVRIFYALESKSVSSHSLLKNIIKNKYKNTINHKIIQ